MEWTEVGRSRERALAVDVHKERELEEFPGQERMCPVVE